MSHQKQIRIRVNNFRWYSREWENKLNEKALAVAFAENGRPSSDIQANVEGIGLDQAELKNAGQPKPVEVGPSKPSAQPSIIESSSVQQVVDETGASNIQSIVMDQTNLKVEAESAIDELGSTRPNVQSNSTENSSLPRVEGETSTSSAKKIYKYILPDGTEVSGDFEKTRATCPVIGGMALEKAKVVCAQADRAHRMAEKGRAIRLAKEKEEQDRMSAIKENPPTAAENKSNLDKPRTIVKRPPAEELNNGHSLKRNDPPKLPQPSSVKLSDERANTDANTKLDHTDKSLQTDLSVSIKLDSKDLSQANNNKASKLYDMPPLPQHNTESEDIAVIASSNNSYSSISSNVRDSVSATTESQSLPELSPHHTDEASTTWQENIVITAPITHKRPISHKVLDLGSSTDLLEGAPVVAKGNSAVMVPTSNAAVQKDFPRPITGEISQLNNPLHDKRHDISEPVASTETIDTHQQLVEVIVMQIESEMAEQKSKPRVTEYNEATGSTEDIPALNIVEIIKAEPTVDKEPASMEQVKADAQDTQPLEQVLAKLSVVLESSPAQAHEPVAKLLAEIAERIAAEPAEASEGTADIQTVFITPEITQLFINLLEELGYKDPGKTLVTFVSQYGIEELLNTAIYLHQLAESGDLKEFLSGRLPAISTDSVALPLSTIIGKTIFQIIKPEVHSLALAA